MSVLISAVETNNVIVTGGIGPRGPAGPPGAKALFITDITPISGGVIGDKVYTPDGKEILSCASDKDNVIVSIACEGGHDEYTPTITVDGIPVTITETSTKRWFTGSVNITIESGVNTITAESSTGTVTTVDVTRVGVGPAILSIVIGSYPGVQTEVKQGDLVPVTITTEPDAEEITILSSTTCNATTIPVVGGVANGNITISTGSGSLTFTAKARNSFGTFGEIFTSPFITINQTYPSFSSFVVTYPVGQLAIKDTESATVSCTVSNFDTISYSGTGLSVDDQNYAVTKTITSTSAAYVVTGTNYTITATRAANNATATGSTLVKLATAPPTASISIAGTPTRLVSSPAGIDYEIRVTPSQQLSSAPTLVSSAGVWQGSWTLNGSYWKRNLRISDADSRGIKSFSGLTLSSLSLVPGSVINAGDSYTVGGLSARVLTFSAFSRVAPIGAAVAIESKTSSSIVGGNVLVRYQSNAFQSNGYYIANVDGSYNPTGSYLGISNTDFSSSNTTGTLQLNFEEVV